MEARGGKDMVINKVEEAEWEYVDVNEYWQQMKKYNEGNSTGHMWNAKGSMQT